MVSGCWEGEWDTFITCSVCVKIRERYCPDGWNYGELRQQIEDCLGFDYTEVEEEEEEDE